MYAGRPPNVGPPPEKFESTLGSGVTLLVLQRVVLNAAGDSVQGRGAGAPPASDAAGIAAPPKVAVLRPVLGVLSDYMLTSGSISLKQSGSAAAGPEKLLQFGVDDSWIQNRIANAIIRRRQNATMAYGNGRGNRGGRGGGTSDAFEFVYYTYAAEKDVVYRATITSWPGQTSIDGHWLCPATIAKNDHIAAPGMTVLVQLKTKEDQVGLLLPQQAYFYKGGKPSVYVVNERNIVEPRLMPASWAKSGIVYQNWGQIWGRKRDEPGVTGDDLIVADASAVKPGMVIRPDFIAGALEGPAAPIEFAEKPLTDAVKYLQDAHHIQIKIDERGLAAAGVKPDVACTMYLHNVSLATALRLLLRSVGLTYVAEDGHILITAPGQKTNAPRPSGESTIDARGE